MQPIKHITSFIFYRMDRCQNCNSEYSLEIYDYFNTPMGYRSIIDLFTAGKQMPKSYLNKRAFYTIRCKKCGKCYPIKWVRGFPLPDFGTDDFKMFLREFKYQGK